MRLRNRHVLSKPEIMIIPMIDIMFFLLVFFMLSTLYMVDLKTISVNLPVAKQVEKASAVELLVTIKKDGSLWLADQQINEKDLIAQAKIANASGDKVSLVIRADKDVEYGRVISCIDHLKEAGIHLFGLAVNSGGNS